jgi:hypothetical protein
LIFIIESSGWALNPRSARARKQLLKLHNRELTMASLCGHDKEGTTSTNVAWINALEI